MRTLVLSSGKTGGTRWLATRVAGDHENPVCWSLPFDASPGAVSRLVLTWENRLDLDELFRRNLDREVLP
jgi:hypothetical protein